MNTDMVKKIVSDIVNLEYDSSNAEELTLDMIEELRAYLNQGVINLEEFGLGVTIILDETE